MNLPQGVGQLQTQPQPPASQAPRQQPLQHRSSAPANISVDAQAVLTGLPHPPAAADALATIAAANRVAGAPAHFIKQEHAQLPAPSNDEHYDFVDLCSDDDDTNDYQPRQSAAADMADESMPTDSPPAVRQFDNAVLLCAPTQPVIISQPQSTWKDFLYLTAKTRKTLLGQSEVQPGSYAVTVQACTGVAKQDFTATLFVYLRADGITRAKISKVRSQKPATQLMHSVSMLASAL